MSDAAVSETAVRIEKLGKDFPASGAGDNSFAFVRRFIESDRRAGVHKALDDITFEVKKGELVALVGHNGAGKTTLLKSIAGIYRASRGTVEVSGQLGLLSGLGVGMVNDLSVRDNIYLYGSICRLSHHRVDSLFQEILDWAELTEFVQTPFRNLSAGMKTRLAFAVAMHNESEVLLIDEALSAGDKSFKDKCNAYFAELRVGPATSLISTHDMDFVAEFCHKTLWLEHGGQIAFGHTDDVLPQFLRNG